MSLSVCIYCASSNAINSVYYQETEKLARLLAQNNVNVKFGGGSSGLMGKIADVYVEENNDNIVGIIPKFMCEEGWQHQQLKQLIVTETMHERKQKMIENNKIYCDICGECEPIGRYLMDTLEELANDGWTKKKVNGDWENYCPECSEPKKRK